MTAIRSARPITTSIRCSTISTVLPSSTCTDRISSTSVVDVLDRDAGHRLVEHDHVGLARRAASRARACAGRRARAGPRATRRVPPRPTRSSASLGPLGPDPARPPPDPHRPAELGVGRQPHVLPRRSGAERRSRPGTSARARARAPERRRAGDVVPVQLDRPRRRPEEAREQVEERRLAGAVRADDADELARADLERDIGDDSGAADVEPEVPVARIGAEVATIPEASGRCRLAPLRRSDELALDPGVTLGVKRVPFWTSFTWNIGWIIA